MNRKIKIMFLIGQYPEEERIRRVNTINRYETVDVEIDVEPINDTVSPYFSGISGLHVAQIAPLVVQKAKEIEERGYDAIIPLGMLDLGAEEAKYVVDIPVVGPAKSTYLMARMLADKFGVIVYHKEIIPFMYMQARSYGILDSITNIRTIDIQLPDLKDNVEMIKTEFVRLSKKAIEEGAQAMVAAGISMCPVHYSPFELEQAIGAPVLDGIGCPIRIAEALVRQGYSHSRLCYPKTPI